MRKIVGLILLALATTSLKAQTATEWTLVITGEATKVAIKDIAFLLADDYAPAFNIVCNNGTVIPAVESAEIRQGNPSAIVTARQSANPAIRFSGNWLTVSGIADGTQAAILDATGRQRANATACGTQAMLPLGNLAAGIYILQVGKTTVKFIKR